MTRMVTRCLLAICLLVLAYAAPTPTPVPTPTPTPTPSPTTTTTTSLATTTTVATSTTALSTTEQTQRLTQEITASSLAVNFLQQYKDSMVSATGVSVNKVVATIDKIVVKVTATFSGTITNVSALEAAFAEHAGVPASAVTIEFLRRRLREMEHSAEVRRLQTQVSVSIDVPNATDVVTKARTIHTQMQNTNALATVVSQKTGVSGITAQTQVTFKVTVSTQVTTDSFLSTDSIDSAVGAALGGTVVTTQIDGVTTTGHKGENSAWSTGYSFVTCVSVVSVVASHLGSL